MQTAILHVGMCVYSSNTSIAVAVYPWEIPCKAPKERTAHYLGSSDRLSFFSLPPLSCHFSYFFFFCKTRRPIGHSGRQIRSRWSPVKGLVQPWLGLRIKAPCPRCIENLVENRKLPADRGRKERKRRAKRKGRSWPTFLASSPSKRGHFKQQYFMHAKRKRSHPA